MHEDDYRLAAQCGYGRMEARQLFDEAASSYERMRETVETMYREREDRAESVHDGETMRELVDRYMKHDW